MKRKAFVSKLQASEATFLSYSFNSYQQIRLKKDKKRTKGGGRVGKKSKKNCLVLFEWPLTTRLFMVFGLNKFFIKFEQARSKQKQNMA